MFWDDRLRRPGYWELDLNFAKTTRDHRTTAVPAAYRGVQRVQQPDVRRARLQPRHELGGLRPHQPQHDGPVEFPAVHPAWIPPDLLTGARPGSPRLACLLIVLPAPCLRRVSLALLQRVGARSRVASRPHHVGRTPRPLHARLEARWHRRQPPFLPTSNASHRSNPRRVREGDLDHLVFYLLQSTRFTAPPPLEPALSAKRARRPPRRGERADSCAGRDAPLAAMPPDVRARIAALLERARRARPAIRGSPTSASLMHAAFPDAARAARRCSREYLRVDALRLREGVRRAALGRRRGRGGRRCIARAG